MILAALGFGAALVLPLALVVLVGLATAGAATGWRRAGQDFARWRRAHPPVIRRP